MIRPAKKEDAQSLTKLSFESKGHWGYPKEYFEIRKSELTITPGYITKNDVHVFEIEGVIIGYFSIIELENEIEISGSKIDKGHWLEHMFIAPEHIGQGIGTLMFDYLRIRCETKGIRKPRILANPHAGGFHEKMGCSYHGEIPSTIPGRTTPLFVLAINDH